MRERLNAGSLRQAAANGALLPCREPPNPVPMARGIFARAISQTYFPTVSFAAACYNGTK